MIFHFILFLLFPFFSLSEFIISTLAGGSSGSNNGIGTNAKFSNVISISISSNDNYALIADYSNNQIRYLNLETNEVSIFAGLSGGNVNGIGTNSKFNSPSGIDISSDDSFALVVDSNNNQIRKLIISTREVNSFAGSTSGNNNGIGTNGLFKTPYEVSISSDDSFAVIADYGNHQIRKIIISTSEVSLLAGGTTSGSSNGIGSNAKFNLPVGSLISNDNSYLLIADYNNNQIRKLIISTLEVSLFAGLSVGSTNGIGTNALFNGPRSLSLSLDGNSALIVDRTNNQIREIDISTAQVSLIAGNPSKTAGSSNGIGTNSFFSSPRDIVYSSDNSYALIVDLGNSAIRKITNDRTFNPSTSPTFTPSSNPSFIPSSSPTFNPSSLPTFNPSVQPTFTPSSSPTFEPTFSPTVNPTFNPSSSPTFIPSSTPTFNPSTSPTSEPSFTPSSSPTFIPSVEPTFNPSSPPTFNPSTNPTFIPTVQPTFNPSTNPTFIPSIEPSCNPSSEPTFNPSSLPTFIPSSSPTFNPSTNPTFIPSSSPTLNPTLYCDIRVSIVGDKSRNIFTSSSLTLQTNLIDCKESNVIVGVGDISYLWSIIDITSSSSSSSSSNNNNKTNDSDLNLSSISLKGDKLKIPSYFLKPKSVYMVKVDVKVKININSNIPSSITSSSFSSSIIRVSQSSLVSRISGGSSQMINQGEVCVLDGSESYDPDISPSQSSSSLSSSSYLSSEWSCNHINNNNNINNNNSSLSCSISVSSDGFKANISPSSLSNVGEIFVVKLKIKDKNNSSRTSESSIFLTISAPKSPKISISLSSTNNNNNLNLNKINSQDSLLLLGKVELFVSNTPIMWSVNDESLNSILNSISQTPVKSSSLIVGVNQFNLLISGGSLLWKSTPYIFSLSSISSSFSSSSISISINRPPQSGIFTSDPLRGNVMETKFHLSVSSWEDEDIPLSYEFFYLSNGRNILRRQSEFTFVDSMLPLGSSSNNNKLDCWVRVFDSLNGVSSSMISLIVSISSSSSSSSSSSLSPSNLLQTSSSLLMVNNNNNNNSKIQTESIIQSVSLLSSILNWKDCSLVSSKYCLSLNRNNCSSTKNTCGSCLSGYLGANGDDNSLCVDETIYQSLQSKLQSNNNNNNTIKCSSDSNCLEWESCVSNVCKMKNKECKVSDCSNHGLCELVNSESNDKVSNCGIFDNSCEAVCVCNEGYLGDGCEVSESEMSIIREIRSQMVIGLLKVANEDLKTDSNEDSNVVISESNVLSMFSSLSSASSSSWELSSESSNSILEVLSMSLNGGEILGLSHESMSNDMFDCLESVGLFQIQSSSLSSSNNNSTNNNNNSTLLLSLLDDFTQYISNQVVEGQNSLESINRVFRTKVETISLSNLNNNNNNNDNNNNSNIISFSSNIPQTKSEILSNTPSTSYSIFSNSSSSSSSNSESLSLISMSIKSDLVNLESQLELESESSTLTSNMLRLKMSGSGYSSISTITVVLQTIRSQSYPVYESDVFVNTSCVENVVSEKVHVCKGPLGEVSITHHCNGTTSGLIISKCPRQSIEPSCHVSSLSSFNCSMINHTSSTITCKCDRIIQNNIENENNNNNRKLSSDGESILSDSGALEVVAISVIVMDSFEETITTTMSVSDVKKVLIVILLYGLLWAGGLLGMLLCSIRYGYGKVEGLEMILGKKVNNSDNINNINNNNNSNKMKSDIQMKKELASLTRSRDDIRQYLLSYVSEILPSVFRPKTGIVRFWEEVSKTHRYLLLFTASGEDGDKKRMLTGIQLLTVQTMLMFILAVFYDLQFPSDDGECKSYEDEKSCLSPKSVLDSSNNLCRWVSSSNNNDNNNGNDEFICEPEPINMTIRTLVIISIYVSMFTAIINLVVDFLFEDILFAPTMDSKRKMNDNKNNINNNNKLKEKEMKESSIISKLKSNEIIKEEDNNEEENEDKESSNNNTTNSNSYEEIETRKVSSPSELTSNNNNSNQNRKTILTKMQSGKFDLETTRLVPSSTQEAHDLAVISMKDIMKDQVSDINKMTILQKLRREKSSSLKQKSSLEKYRESLRNRGESRKVKLGMNRGMDEIALEEQFLELTVDIMEQRKQLKRSQQDGFDEMWGIDPTGEFSKQRQNYLLFWSQSKSSGDIIKKELKFVEEESKKRIHKLEYSSDVQRGLEILHYFILDLLGRDTPVAKIFLTKTEEDFRHSYVVTKFTKFIAWICVIVLNLFFVYFSMLRGLQRGFDWQRLYCIACILQLVVEVVFYETSECAIVNFFIPNLARTEVQGVTFAIYQAIQSICGSGSSFHSNIPILDAPRYLFLSTRLSEKFPDLLESVIVRSYHSYSPGELSYKWKISHSSPFSLTSNSIFDSIFDWNSRSRIGSRVRRVTFTSLLISFLQYIGSVSISVQRFFIHASQPLVTAALGYLLTLIYHNPLYLLIFVPLLGYWCYDMWSKWYYEDNKSVEDVIVPIIESNNNNNNNNNNIHKEIKKDNNKETNKVSNQINNNNINNNINNNSKEELKSKLNVQLESDLDSQLQSESEMDENISQGYSYSSGSYDNNNINNNNNNDNNQFDFQDSFSDDYISYDDSSFQYNFTDNTNNTFYQHKKRFHESISSDDVNFQFDGNFEINSFVGNNNNNENDNENDNNENESEE